jgi:hypothetical protein
MMATTYERRLVWAASLLRDVMATLGRDAGVAWWRDHRDGIKRNLAAVQREWNEEKRNLRVASDAGTTGGDDATYDRP